MNAIKLLMNAKSEHIKHINESKFYILGCNIETQLVEGYVLKSTTLSSIPQVLLDSSSPELSN